MTSRRKSETIRVHNAAAMLLAASVVVGAANASVTNLIPSTTGDITLGRLGAEILAGPFPAPATNACFVGYGTAKSTRTFVMMAMDAESNVIHEVALGLGDYPIGKANAGPFKALECRSEADIRYISLVCTGGSQNVHVTALRLALDDGFESDAPQQAQPEIPPPIAMSALRGGRYVFEADNLARWQFFAGETAITQIKNNAGTTQYQGFYLFTKNGVGPFLGSLSTSGVTRRMGIGICNDSEAAVEGVTVRLTMAQFGKLNSVAEEIVMEYALAKEPMRIIDGSSWLGVAGFSFVTPAVAGDGVALPVTREYALDLPISIERGETLYLRWTDSCPPTGKNAAWGLGNFIIRLSPAVGLQFIVR